MKYMLHMIQSGRNKNDCQYNKLVSSRNIGLKKISNPKILHHINNKPSDTCVIEII